MQCTEKKKAWQLGHCGAQFVQVDVQWAISYLQNANTQCSQYTLCTALNRRRVGSWDIVGQSHKLTPPPPPPVPALQARCSPKKQVDVVISVKDTLKLLYCCFPTASVSRNILHIIALHKSVSLQHRAHVLQAMKLLCTCWLCHIGNEAPKVHVAHPIGLALNSMGIVWLGFLYGPVGSPNNSEGPQFVKWDPKRDK